MDNDATQQPSNHKYQIKSFDNVYTGDFFFSDYVRELIAKVFDIPKSEKNHFDVLSEVLTMDFDKFDSELNRLLIEKDVSYDLEAIHDMNEYLEKIVPLIQSVSDRFDEIVKHDGSGQALISIIEPNFYWTGNWRRYFVDSINIALNKDINIFTGETTKEDDTIRCIISLFIITSGLEQALGNLILTQSHFVPPLLKTLLTMPELENLIEIRLIRLLKIIVGPPITINLRNILWHGFVNSSTQLPNRQSHDIPIEIDYRRFYYFLLSISATIGIELQKKNILQKLKLDLSKIEVNETPVLKSLITECIPQRRLFNFNEFSSKLETVFPIFNLNDLTYGHIKTLIIDCPLIHKTQRPLWFAAFQLYFFGLPPYRFYSFCLLMPLMESCLRYLYCSVNQMPDRLLTAVCREYYVTFTEILAFNKMMDGTNDIIDQTQPNQLYHLLPKPYLILLLDMILLPEGLRFRDRLSHGQVELHNLNPIMANYVICSVIVLLELSRTNFDLSLSLNLPIITKGCLEYECLYHPVYQLKSQLKLLTQSLVRLVGHVKSSQTENGEIFHHQLIDALEANLHKIQAVNYELSEPFISQCEPPVLLLRNCLANYVLFVENLDSFLVIRAQEMSQSRLRSRQRANYQTFLQNIPHYLKSFISDEMLFWNTQMEMFTRLERVTDQWCTTLTQKTEKSLDKMLKHLLKLAQNLVRHSSITENRWDKVNRICQEQGNFLRIVYEFICT